MLDVLMPDLDGRETLDLLRQINPAVRCCFATAKAIPYTEAELKARGALCVLKKPFSLTELSQTLWRLAVKVS